MNFDGKDVDLMLNLETCLYSYLSSIEKANEWKKFHPIRLKSHLIYQIEQNIDFFHTIHMSLSQGIQLQNVPIRLRHDSQEIIDPNSLLRFVQDQELVEQAEETMSRWIKDIDAVCSTSINSKDNLNLSPSSIKKVH